MSGQVPMAQKVVKARPRPKHARRRAMGDAVRLRVTRDDESMGFPGARKQKASSRKPRSSACFCAHGICGVFGVLPSNMQRFPAIAQRFSPHYGKK